MSFRKNIENLKLSDLIYVKELGFGQFGDVFLVVEKEDHQKQYAIKTITRQKINEHGIEGNIVNEKRVLEKINHPFIVRLYKTFKDNYAAYFLLNRIEGLDMFDLIR